MSKDKIERYRKVGGLFLHFTLSSVWSIFKSLMNLGEISTILSGFQYRLGEPFEEDAFFMNFYIFILFLNFVFVIFRCIGILIRNRKWVTISLLFIPASILALLVAGAYVYTFNDSYTAGTFFISLLVAFFWIVYLYTSDRTSVYFASEEEYAKMLENATSDS